jgi:hypothetical protein
MARKKKSSGKPKKVGVVMISATPDAGPTPPSPSPFPSRESLAIPGGVPPSVRTHRVPPIARDHTVVHRQISPRTRISHTKETLQYPDDPTPHVRYQTHIRHQIAPGVSVFKTRETTTPVRPRPSFEPSQRLRYSGNPNAFRFGRKPTI